MSSERDKTDNDRDKKPGILQRMPGEFAVELS